MLHGNHAGLIIGSLVWLVAGCAPPAPGGQTPADQSAPAAAPKRIIAAIQGDPPSLHPALNPAGAARGSESLTDMVHVGLAVVDSQGILRPRLAEAIPSLENSQWRILPDGRMDTTWKIRSNAVWHDGVHFTADDLVFTIQIDKDPDLPQFSNIGFVSIDEIQAVDPQTVTVYWKRPYIDADFLFTRRLALPLPKHLLERPYTEEKTSFTELPYFSTEFIGTGPYKVRELVRASHLSLRANDQFALGRPQIDEIEVQYITDSNTLAANLLAGAIDATLGKTVSLDQALQVRDQWKDGHLEVAPSNAIQIYPQFLNPSPVVVGTKDFRKALMFALDRKQMIDSFLAGQSSIAEAWVNPADPPEQRAALTNIVHYDYDPARAAQLIEGLGYTKGSDGLFHEATTGDKLGVELRTTTDNEILVQTQLSIVDYWQKLGVAVDPVVIPPQRAQDLPYRATFPSFEELRGPSDLRTLTAIHSSAARTPENNFRGASYTRYMNPAFDALIERYFATIPMNDRMQVAGQILQQITDEVIVMTLFWDIEPALISNRLSNVAARQKDSSNGWNSNEWDIR